VWLIGASSGIGRAVAALLHARGARVCVSARQQTLLDAFVREHPGSQALALDVTDAQATADAAQQLLAGGPLDLVCYCAGHYRPMSADALNLPELLQHQRVNVTGTLQVLAAVLPSLLQAASAGRNPHLSLVASVAGWRGLPQSLAYGPTKAALINLAENLFLDLRPKGVGVSLVNPGFVDTPLTAQNRFDMPALLTPEQAALAIVRGWERGQFEMHFPKRFTGVLKLMRCLPYRWYFPLIHRLTGL
jgi:short-subunit dehydrogenase